MADAGAEIGQGQVEQGERRASSGLTQPARVRASSARKRPSRLSKANWSAGMPSTATAPTAPPSSGSR